MADFIQRSQVQILPLREDRILAEIHATDGDVRRICDLFGLSVAGAVRYAGTHQPDIEGHGAENAPEVAPREPKP